MDTTEVRLERPTESIAHATLRIVRPEVGNSLSRVAAEQLSAAGDRLAAAPPPGAPLAPPARGVARPGGARDEEPRPRGPPV